MAAPFKKHEPVGKLVFERSSFLDTNEKHNFCISEHYFNSAIHILCPSTSVIPAEIDEIMTRQMSYQATNVSLQTLLSMDFIEGFIKRGAVYMLSHGTSIDSDDCVALLPTGTLILSLTKDTFQHLGLEGRLAKYGTSYIGHGKHVVEIELGNPKFFPEMKHYERVKWCFSDRLNLTFDFLLSWKPNDTKVCPSSIQNFFQSNGCVCKRIKIPKKTTKYENFRVPVISPDVLHERETKNRPGAQTMSDKKSNNSIIQEIRLLKSPSNGNMDSNSKQISKKQKSVKTSASEVPENSDISDSDASEDDMDMDIAGDNETIEVDKCGADNDEQSSCGYLEVFEWLGACAAGIDLDNIEEDSSAYVSSLTCPSPNITVPYSVSMEYRGLITPHSVQAVVDRIRTVMQEKNLPWCCVSVHGFMDSPVSWCKRLHGFYSTGDNLYSLLMFNDGSYWLYRAFGAKDIAT